MRSRENFEGWEEEEKIKKMLKRWKRMGRLSERLRRRFVVAAFMLKTSPGPNFWRMAPKEKERKTKCDDQQN